LKSIKIIDVINSEFAVAPEDGELVFLKIKDCIEKSIHLSLDFDGVDLTTTAFLNTAIGTLYRDFDKDTLNEFITMKNVSNSDLVLIKTVIERAKLTFTDELAQEFGDE
jgi:hypothetical protein